MIILLVVTVMIVLKEKYDVELDVKVKGSIEMFETNLQKDQDFLFPAGQLGKDLNGEITTFEREYVIFRTPLVFYTWAPINECLVKKGFVVERQGAYYLTDLTSFYNEVKNRKKWSELCPGLPEKEMLVDTSNPKTSNSGATFFALLSQIIQSGRTITEQNYKVFLPELKDYYSRLGFQENSSNDIFQDYIDKGIGEKTMIAGYENQIIQYAQKDRANWIKKKNDYVMIYPNPTVWSDHNLLIKNKSADVLAELYHDQWVHDRIWLKFGFRTPNLNEEDLHRWNVKRIAKRIDSINMMKGSVMKLILKDL